MSSLRFWKFGCKGANVHWDGYGHMVIVGLVATRSHVHWDDNGHMVIVVDWWQLLGWEWSHGDNGIGDNNGTAMVTWWWNWWQLYSLCWYGSGDNYSLCWYAPIRTILIVRIWTLMRMRWSTGPLMLVTSSTKNQGTMVTTRETCLVPDIFNVLCLN